MDERELKFPSATICEIETWRCPNCNVRNDAAGIPQCGCGYMRPGYDCCAWCDDFYGPIAVFHYHEGDPLCPSCLEWKHGESRSIYLGVIALFAVAILIYWCVHIIVNL